MFAASKTSRLVPAGPTSDTYFNYVTSLLNGDGTNGGQNNTFLDSSTNNFTITRNGDTTQGTFGPFNGGNYSNYFDGSGDSLDIPNSAAFNQSGAWTVEMWVFPTTSTVNQYWYSQVTPNFLQIATNSSGFVVVDKSSVGIQLTATTAVQTNAWNHVAMISTGTLIGLFVNGILQGTASIGTTAASATTTRIGAYQSTGGLAFTGFISNVRVTKGTALYTSNFTPSTLPLNTTSQTVLLTCASNRFEDLSGANSTITKNGDTRIQTFSPFVQSSSTPTSYGVTFNGSSDYLSVGSTPTLPSTTTPFTIECWVYPTVQLSGTALFSTNFTGGGQAIPFCIFGATNINTNTSGSNLCAGYYTGSAWVGISSTTSLTLNQWSHVALVFNGTVATLYLNGVSIGSATTSWTTSTATPFLIGRRWDTTSTPYFGGNISNFRIVVGSAIYTANFTPPTTPLTAVSGTQLLTCQDTTFKDNSINAYAITANGSARPVKGNPFGYTIAATTGYSVASNAGSAYFDGSGDYLSIAQNAAFNFASGNFTIEAWVYVTSSTNSDQSIIASNQSWGAGAVVLKCYHGGNISFSAYDYNSSGTAMLSTPATLNTWNHVALVRNGNVFTLYVNGVNSSSITSTISVNFAPIGGTYVGYDGPINSTTGYVIGYISNLRVLKGTALYTSAFVPSVSPLTAITNTQLLMLMSNASIIDNAEQNDFQTVGAAQISTSVKKYGTGSVSLNGTNSYLLTNYQPSQVMGAGNFTIEGWIYPTASTGSAYRPIVVSSIFNTFSNSDLQYMLYLQTSGYITFQAYVGNTAYAVQSSTTVSLNTWTYVTVVRNGATITLYVNGTSVSTSNISTNTLNSSVAYTLRYGGYVNANTFYYFSGNLDEFRVTKGIARYTANFTPPVAAFPNY